MKKRLFSLRFCGQRRWVSVPSPPPSSGLWRSGAGRDTAAPGRGTTSALEGTEGPAAL